jgi:hypothetical protein
MEKKPLGLLIQERFLLEDRINGNDGLLTEELDKLWDDNETELTAKVDAYAFTLAHLESIKEYLRKRKTKANQIIQSIDNNLEQIKARLYYYAGIIGGPLRGNEYSFHPYISIRRNVNLELVESDYKKVQVEMSYIDYERLKKILTQDRKISEETISITKLGEVCNVSDLPEGHPGIIESRTPSVRVL